MPNPAVIPIDDPEDPRIASYRAVRERDVVGRGERFVAEGEVVLRLLLGENCRHRVESVMMAEKRLAALAPLLAAAPLDTPVYVAAQAVMDAVVGFSIHRGVLAIGRRAPERRAAALLADLPAKALVVALVGLSNHDNMGGVFRNAAAFGADAVLLDGTCCDPLYRKAIRVSVGASLTLPFSRGGTGAELLEALDAGGFANIALSPSADRTIGDIQARDRTALMLGAEGPGLPPALMARTQAARIAMAAGFDSLNVAVASGVALYEMSRRR